MKRKLICAVLLSAAPGLVHASGVIAVSCGNGTSALASSTTCSNTATYGSVLETFDNNLQWNGANDITSPTLSATELGKPAAANGYMYDTTWTAVGLPISVSGSALELADNYYDVARGTLWTPATVGPQTYQGTFNAQPNPSAGSPGDYLVGSGNGDAITIASTSGLRDFGFRISSQDLTAFDVVVQLYGISGNLIGSQTFTDLGGGGTCTTLGISSGQPTPMPCNTAPFIKVATSTAVYSFAVYTTQTNGQSDNRGFYMDTFYYSGSVPEPASLVLAGAGLVSMIAFARRRNGRKTLGHVGAEAVDKA